MLKKKKSKDASRAFDNLLREVFSPRDKSRSETKLISEKSFVIIRSLITLLSMSPYLRILIRVPS